jgi:hypothetical protein
MMENLHTMDKHSHSAVTELPLIPGSMRLLKIPLLQELKYPICKRSDPALNQINGEEITSSTQKKLMQSPSFLWRVQKIIMTLAYS